MHQSRNNKGFTLIELLVVISIIALLASIVLASLNSARTKARDANRSASIRQVQTALEFYYDTNGRYPTSADEPLSGAFASALVPTYIPVMPVSPSTGAYRSYNGSQNPATWYAIFVPYETKPACYKCAGTTPGCCGTDRWWGVNMCQ